MWSSQCTEVQTEHQNEEKQEIVFGVRLRQVGLSLSENAGLLGFSHLSHSLGVTENGIQ